MRPPLILQYTAIALLNYTGLAHVRTADIAMSFEFVKSWLLLGGYIDKNPAYLLPDPHLIVTRRPKAPRDVACTNKASTSKSNGMKTIVATGRHV